MSIIGNTYVLNSRHPQALIDDLYREYFDAHPADAKIDLILAVKPLDADEDGIGKTIQVWGAKIMRVSNPEYDAGNTSVSPHRFLTADAGGDEPRHLLRHMVEWPNTVPGATGFIWIHKGPEGMAYATESVIAWHEVLASMDFGINDDYEDGDAEKRKRRHHFMSAVVNRYSSQPLNPALPEPETDFVDLDIAIISKMAMASAKRYKIDDPNHPFMIALAKHLDAQRYIRETEDRHGEAEHMRAHQLATESGADMGRELLAAAKQRIDLPPELADMFAELGEVIDLYDQTKGSEPKIGFRRPEIVPGTPAPRPKDIMSLPEFGIHAADNVKKPDLLN